jgi:1-acyl-sn-glycerol-3-phosphate acyltransferase
MTEGLPRPTDAQLATLEGFERTAFAISDVVNRRPLLKRAAHAFLRTVGRTWVHVCTKNIMHASGIEQLSRLQPDRGVILVANHRSFFDSYVIASVLLRKTEWVDRMYFPVRSEFFYERPAGVLVNGIMSAWAMYPPVLRRPTARTFNDYTVDYLVSELQRPGTVVGMHPEGTRNKTDDPYTLLPAQPGIGQMVHKARPIVVPVFVLGLGNDLPRQVRGNFNGTGDPITMVFGPPVDLERFFAEPPRLRTYKRIADHLRERLMELGEVEREIRAKAGFPRLHPNRAGAATAQ